MRIICEARELSVSAEDVCSWQLDSRRGVKTSTHPAAVYSVYSMSYLIERTAYCHVWLKCLKGDKSCHGSGAITLHRT